ncbi:MAG: hypothetical protein MK035_04065 [Dehalococcoidia bacterium]|nr:hypothetical protein [Dehalococcoidia bacterium]
MTNHSLILKILAGLYEIIACGDCDTRLRYGDYECPHCGKDVEEELQIWAIKLLENLNIK